MKKSILCISDDHFKKSVLGQINEMNDGLIKTTKKYKLSAHSFHCKILNVPFLLVFLNGETLIWDTQKNLHTYLPNILFYDKPVRND